MKHEVAVICEKGRRPTMEDAYYFFDGGSFLFGGVYDGHNGFFAAQYARGHLHQLFFRELEKKAPEEAFVAAYEEVSQQLKNQESGTTAVNFYLKNNTLYWANVGDTRLVIIANNQINQLTQDHRVDNPEEAKRIIACGGKISGHYVVKGGFGLMPTRTLGDIYFKGVGVIATPTTGQYQLSLADKWLLAGTDGLFDYLGNQEVSLLLEKFEAVDEAAQALKNEVLVNRSGNDNLSFILVKLPTDYKEVG